MSALVTGVQTCALPISVQGGHSDRALKRTAGLRLGGGTARTGQPYCRSRAGGTPMGRLSAPRTLVVTHGPRAEGPGRAFERSPLELGRAACRERVCQYVSSSVVDAAYKKKKKIR